MGLACTATGLLLELVAARVRIKSVFWSDTVRGHGDDRPLYLMETSKPPGALSDRVRTRRVRLARASSSASGG